MANTDLQLLQPLIAKTLGHRPSPATIWRWITRGVKVGSDRVKLRAIRVGGKLYGTVDDVQAFIDAQNAPQVADADDGSRDESTERRLQAAGLL